MEKVIIATESLITVRSCRPQGFREWQGRVENLRSFVKQQLGPGTVITGRVKMWRGGLPNTLTYPLDRGRALIRSLSRY